MATTVKHRAVFYPTDEETSLLIECLQGYLQDKGLKGTAADAIRFAIHRTTKRLGLKRSEPSGESPEATNQPWPWCDACKSWHHPKNPTCVNRESKAPKRKGAKRGGEA